MAYSLQLRGRTFELGEQFRLGASRFCANVESENKRDRSFSPDLQDRGQFRALKSDFNTCVGKATIGITLW